MPNAYATNNRVVDPPDQDEWLIFCQCAKAKSVYTLLSCLRNIGVWVNNSTSSSRSNEKRDGIMTQSRSALMKNSIQPVTVFCYPKNMTFHVIGKSKQIQASVSMQSGLFSQYKVMQSAPQRGDQEEKTEDWHSEGEFCVNLSTVLQCLNLLGTQSLERMKLTLSYNLTKELFTLELTDDAGVLSTANIPGMQPPEDDLFGDSLALAMRSSPIAARIILKSDTLREILIELESVGGAKVGTVSLNARSFDIAVVGDLSECLVSIPCQGDHVVSLECPSSSSSSASYNFPLHSLLGSLRGLEIAEETCITINSNGMMAIQHQVIDPTTGDGTPSFVDFIMCSLDETDDSTAEPPEEVPNSQRYDDSQSQLLASPGTLSRDDEQSRAMSRSAKMHDGYDSSDKSNSSVDNDGSEMASASSLFGSVVRTTGPRPTDLARRAARRRRQHSPEERPRATDDGHGSDGSRDLLADSSSSDDEEEEMQALDVSTRRNAYNDTDRGNTSSPELVYGRQH